jgi:hypothetical protein
MRMKKMVEIESCFMCPHFFMPAFGESCNGDCGNGLLDKSKVITRIGNGGEIPDWCPL